MIREDSAFFAHRAEFPALEQRAYLNFGARGVLSQASQHAVLDSLQTLQAVGPSSRAGNAWINYEVTATRSALAGLLHVSAKRVALLDSVSSACALCIWGIAWRPGDHLLICESEPPGTWAAARQAAARFGIHLESFSAYDAADPERFANSLSAALRPASRLVIASHVNWVSGSQLPLPLLTRLIRGGPSPQARVLIDGAQAVGVVPVDLSSGDVDYYALGSQKWLGGPDGVGALYISEQAQGGLDATLTGWRGVQATDDALDFCLATDANRYESGSGAYALFAGLRAAIEIQAAFAPIESRSARILSLNRLLRTRLTSLGASARLRHLQLVGTESDSGITSFTLAGTSARTLQEQLDRSGVILKRHFVPECLRVCVHYLTSLQDIEALCEALQDGPSRHDGMVRLAREL